MKSMSTSLIAAVLVLLAAGILPATAAVEIDGDPEAPSYYWPGPEGLTLKRESIARSNGEIYRRGENRMVCGPESEFRGLPVRLDDIVISIQDVGGEAMEFEITVMQAVNDSVSCTLGMEFASGNTLLEETPYIDLQAPLRRGAGWRYVNEMPVLDPVLDLSVDWSIEAEVVDTGLNVTVPAGTFSNCILVRETCRSVESIQLEGGPNAGRRVRFEHVIERWWSPGLGCIRERSRTRTLAAGVSAGLIAETTFESDLTEIVRP